MIDKIEERREKAREASRKYRERHPERAAASVRKYYANNKEKANEANRKWRAENKEYVREYDRKRYLEGNNRYSREIHIKRTYNLTLDKFNQMAEEQDNSCAICCEPIDDSPHVDHDHETGMVRGLLCRNCNLGLGYFKDNTDVISKAIKYVNKYKEV